VLGTATGFVMRGDLGIPSHRLDDFRRQKLADQLTREKKAWDDDKAERVCCLRHADCHVWVPRHFDTSLWDNVHDWEWTEGEPHRFALKPGILDPERGQTHAVPAMIEHLRQHSGGILIAPTGTGKTLMGCAIASAFGRKIGVPVYVGHMMDNWIFHAKKVLGLRDEDIGIVKRNRCDIGKPITLLSVQTLLSRGVPEALQKQIGVLVCDEVHRYGAKVWREIVAQFPAKYRLGLTASIERKDGLEDVVSWSFGAVGHTTPRIRNEEVKAPRVVMMAFTREYPVGKYHKWKKDPVSHEWQMGEPDPGKYDKLLSRDRVRTQMIAEEIANAARTGRQVLVLARHVAHLDQLKNDTRRALDPIHPIERIAKRIPYPADHRFVNLATLKAGLDEDERRDVEHADVIFATYMMARDALNVPKLDTLVFATPPGDITQPMGRLREKVEDIERRDLLILDSMEKGVGFSKGRGKKRIEGYTRMGCEVKVVTRTVKAKT